MIPDTATMTPPWTSAHAEAARREGWDIWHCSTSSYGLWQVCKFDDPESTDFGFTVPALDDDDAAMWIVFNGNEAHHWAARAFIQAHCQEEWDRIAWLTSQEKT